MLWVHMFSLVTWAPVMTSQSQVSKAPKCNQQNTSVPLWKDQKCQVLRLKKKNTLKILNLWYCFYLQNNFYSDLRNQFRSPDDVEPGNIINLHRRCSPQIQSSDRPEHIACELTFNSLKNFRVKLYLLILLNFS